MDHFVCVTSHAFVIDPAHRAERAGHLIHPPASRPMNTYTPPGLQLSLLPYLV